ncbi:MAG TPA: hypothetical protein VF062_25700 [Candidatus Limnocylindrales bacterium]
MTGLYDQFGNPQSVKDLADGAKQTATDMKTLTDTVNRDVNATVPDMWGGPGASSFQQFMWRFSRAIAGLGSPIDYYNQELAAAAQTMDAARQQLQEAEEFAGHNGVTINPDLSVSIPDASRPGAQEALQHTRQLLDRAAALSEQAKQQVRRANELMAVTAERSTREMLEIAGAIAGGGSGRRPGRRRRPGVGGPRLGGGSGRRRRGTEEEENQMVYGPEGKIRKPAEHRGQWLNDDGTPSNTPGHGIFKPDNPQAMGIHPRNPGEIRWVEGVPDLRPHAVPWDQMPRGWGPTVPHVEGLPLTGRNTDAGLADAVAGRHVGWNAEQFRAFREQNGFVWHHYSHHEMTLVPRPLHNSLAHQGPFR